MNPAFDDALTLPQTAALTRETRIVFGLLEHLRGGLLEIRLPGGARMLFGDGEGAVTLQIHDEAVFARVLTRGDIGLAEAYLDGQWDSPDVAGLLALLARNRGGLAKAIYGSWRQLLSARLRHWLNGNSRAGSKRNIMSHYDLGNEFYRLWLDASMSYSAAIFRREDDGSLLAAQHAKYRRILDRLQAECGDHVLEIGCGWGGFAELAVAEGLRVTGLTLSPAQLEWAQGRVPEADLRLQDYRDTRESYDHVVSIEMFEAVGEKWWPAYFSTVAKALKTTGRAVIQSITIDDALFAAYRRGTDFIQQYVFPGGMLPSRSAFREAAARQGLQVVDEFAFGRDYARTLAEWRAAFDARWPQIAALGFDENFRRLWRFYLAYCEAGFLAGNVDVVQFELVRR
ncbi:cyclopropane-fatty-acyl-phospholipid synthase family protein [uncultured Propionivibrio sp.]|uniref:cyclopropane-fatty-acyl-phospholipid synthase family protein n=1 Tax=uncultured Propionivibrio sp. TaxID=426737 RepID=UPI0029C0EE52|nr:cyclopropane-fatty-acyl-phospholipid synthase family protein [uncultured Propionivibrio sp.]